MDEVLSEGWFDRLAERLARVSTSAPLALGVEVRTTEATRAFHVHLGPEGGTVDRSPSPHADVTMVIEETDAQALLAGDVAAQDLLLDGRLKVRGDPRLLLRLDDTAGARPSDRTDHDGEGFP